MPDESTRRLLKVFGIAVTDLEDGAARALAAAREAEEGGRDPTEVARILADFLGRVSEVNARWLEVTRLVFEREEATLAEFRERLGPGGAGRAA
jgi:hypothetical protein